MTDVAAIAIGRNEGARLVQCLASLTGRASPVIYVDSGSTDGSVNTAREMGAEVVELDMSQPFTAARARNAGFERLVRIAPETAFVQFIDGDCELHPDWIATARDILEAEPDLAVACGRRRERAPEASRWNRMIDIEWDTPVGEVRACGGDALMRRTALEDVGGYRDDLIAGEEPEMCFRMRAMGWRVRRVDAEMTLHDDAMTSFRQWWRRARRAGHAFAEGAALHGRSRERFRIKEVRSILFWGLGIPIGAMLLALVVSPWLILLAPALWGAQVLRLTGRGYGLERAFFLTLGKLPEGQGIADYWFRRLTGQKRGLIEYK